MNRLAKILAGSPHERFRGTRQCLGVFLGLLVSVTGCAKSGFTPTQETSGILDLSAWDPAEHGIASLDGNWAFYPNEFLPPEKLVEEDHDIFLPVPGTWDGKISSQSAAGTEQDSGLQYGTYHLRVKLPAHDGILALRIQSALSAYKLWVDERLVASVGVPGETVDSTVPLYTPRSALFSPEASEVSITIQISNFYHRVGGLYRPVRLGTDQQLLAYERRTSIKDMFVMASIMVMAGYHLIHFGYRRQEVTSLYFAFGCISLIIWYASNNEHLIGVLFPALDARTGLMLDYCSFFASVSFFALFTQAMFPAFYPKLLLYAVIATSVIMTVAVLTRSMLDASRLIPLFQGLTAFYSLASIVALVCACWYRAELAPYILIGLFTFIASVLNDFLYSNGLVQTAWLSPFGLVFLVVTTSMTISVRFRRSFNHINHLKRTFERFVPKRFLMRITDEDLTEFQIGNAKSESLVVLFSDIRGFTTISEGLSPEDLLTYLNHYFLEMATVVKRHHGFIDKFIGDGIMALFDELEDTDLGNASQRAIRAAREMHDALPSLNERLQQRGWPPIRIGIGVHYGPVVMGTVGAEFRMDSTVLGDTVNTAARLEGVSKDHGLEVVFSDTLRQQLPDEDKNAIRELGPVSIRGKKQPLKVFHFDDAATPMPQN